MNTTTNTSTTSATEAKRQPGLTSTIELTGTLRRVTFTRTDTGEQIICDLTALSEAMQWQLMAHGAKAKIGDAAAKSRDTETGHSASLDDKMESMAEVLENLQNDVFNSKKAPGVGPKGGLLVRALSRLYPAKNLPELKAYVKGLSAGEKKALGRNTKVKKIIDEIKAEEEDKAPTSIDTDALLAGLE